MFNQHLCFFIVPCSNLIPKKFAYHSNFVLLMQD